MLSISWMVILGDHGTRKKSFENFDFRAAHGEKLHKQVLYPSLSDTSACSAAGVPTSNERGAAHVALPRFRWGEGGRWPGTRWHPSWHQAQLQLPFGTLAGLPGEPK